MQTMTKSMGLISVILLSSVVSVSYLGAQPNETVTYGDLYLADQDDHPHRPHRLRMAAGYEVGNRLLNVYHLHIGYTYQITELFGLGLMGRTFSSNPTALNKRVESEFSLLGLETETEGPSWSGYFLVSMVPIRGRINFFSLRALPMSLTLSAGPGLRKLQQQASSRESGFWSLANEIFFSERLGANLSFSQEIEDAAGSSIFRSQINAGLTLAL